MPYNLKGRNVLITGGSRGLGAEVARKFAAEGCNIAINYVSNEASAQKLASELQQQYPEIKTHIIRGDGGIMADVTRCVQETNTAFGGLDIAIGNAGFTKFSNFGDLEALSDEEWDKCWAVNVKGMKQLVQASMPIFNANPDGGVAIITSSIAGKTLSGSSMAYSVTKAAQLHLMKCLANTQGKKLRINAVLPGLLLTEWGVQFGEERIKTLKEAAVLKQETLLSDCADMYVAIAKNTSLTGQNIHVDSGIAIQHM